VPAPQRERNERTEQGRDSGGEVDRWQHHSGLEPLHESQYTPNRALDIRHNAVRLQLHALAYNLANFMRFFAATTAAATDMSIGSDQSRQPQQAKCDHDRPRAAQTRPECQANASD
jgi:hypothetical protein